MKKNRTLMTLIGQINTDKKNPFKSLQSASSAFQKNQLKSIQSVSSAFRLNQFKSLQSASSAFNKIIANLLNLIICVK